MPLKMDNLQGYFVNSCRELRNAKELDEWMNTLPIDGLVMMRLMDHLKYGVNHYGCDRDMELTGRFLQLNLPEDKKEVMDWLIDQGIACDCDAFAFVSKLASMAHNQLRVHNNAL